LTAYIKEFQIFTNVDGSQIPSF